MTVTDVVRDTDARTLTITSRFDAPIDRVWGIWSDPRQLERWWGPPSHPATVTDHSLAPGGTVRYFMTGPEGDRHHGWWRIGTADPPRALEFEDGFAEADGTPSAEMPTASIRVTLAEADGGGTRMDITTTWDSDEAMERMLAMGMEEGMKAALGQVDELVVA